MFVRERRGHDHPSSALPSRACANSGSVTATPMRIVPCEKLIRDVESLTAAEASSRVSDESIGREVLIGDEGRASLFVTPRPLMLALTAAMLGDDVSQTPTDREPTAVEQSLFEMLLQELPRLLHLLCCLLLCVLLHLMYMLLSLLLQLLLSLLNMLKGLLLHLLMCLLDLLSSLLLQMLL